MDAIDRRPGNRAPTGEFRTAALQRSQQALIEALRLAPGAVPAAQARGWIGLAAPQRVSRRQAERAARRAALRAQRRAERRRSRR